MKVSSSIQPLIAYVGPVPFPVGGAATRRILGNALALRDVGYRVIVGSGQVGGPDAVEHLGLTVVSLGERTAEGLPTLLKHAAYAGMGRRTRRWLDTLRPRPHAVILYSGYSPYFMRLLPWCRKNAVPLAFDAVEWYGESRTPGGRFAPYRLNFELAMRYFVPRCGNVIAISRYLETYYRQRGCSTIRLPPTLDTAALAPRKPRQAGPLRLGYAGTPGNKDLLGDSLEAVFRVAEAGGRVEFRMAGVEAGQVLSLAACRRRGVHSLPASVTAMGRVPQADALRAIQECDFSVLLRPPTLDSTAGFPTKVVESMSVGTPVICNLTSDLREHVFHGRTGLVCMAPTPEACAQTLFEAAALSPERLHAMSSAACEHARLNFDYRCHAAALGAFIRDLRPPT